MIALIIFVFGDLCTFYERFYSMIPLIIFVFGEFCIFNGRRVDVVAKPPWFHWFFLRWIWQPWTVPSQNCMWKICRQKTAGEKAPSQYCRWKICRWEGVKNSKTSLARQGCSKSMWTCSEFLSLRTRFYRRAGPVVFYSHQSCLPCGGPLCENLTLHNWEF